jgi:hypothetical protein
MKVALKDASGPQMRAFAQSHLGMEFPSNMANEKVRAQIQAAWTKEEIDVEDPVEPPAKTAKTLGDETVTEKVKLIINRTEDAGGDEPVPIGVNGRVMLVPRGDIVEIPLTYFNVLKNAVKDIYESLPDGGMNPVPRKVPAYPFQRLA